jgi:uncharacterized protein YlxP (DUF503 family)
MTVKSIFIGMGIVEIDDDHESVKAQKEEVKEDVKEYVKEDDKEETKLQDEPKNKNKFKLTTSHTVTDCLKFLSAKISKVKTIMPRLGMKHNVNMSRGGKQDFTSARRIITPNSKTRRANKSKTVERAEAHFQHPMSCERKQ